MREIPARCEVEDFISCGLEALIASIERYDPAKGATLEQFAWTRIHGAVLDELRRQDWAPRSVRRWERDITRARDHFLAIHGRMPSRVELGDENSTIERIDTLAADGRDESDPEHSAAVVEAKEKFRHAFERLPQREREVAVLLYVKNLTLREIGEILGVSESRVCQIHSQLKRSLRTALAEDELLFSEVA